MVNLHFQKGNGNSTLTKGNFCPANGEYLKLRVFRFVCKPARVRWTKLGGLDNLAVQESFPKDRQADKKRWTSDRKHLRGLRNLTMILKF